jgi:uncharacterized repeat protein (TIGR01451 family)
MTECGAAVVTSNSNLTISFASASLTLTKTALPQIFNDIGQQVTYTYTITNSGQIILGNLGISDNNNRLATSFSGTLGPNKSTTTSVIYYITAADVAAGSITSTDHATAIAVGLPIVNVSSSISTVTVTYMPTTISLTKSASPVTFYQAGQVITYTYNVINGILPLTGVTIHDSIPVVGNGIGASQTFTATYITTLANVAAGFITNVATVTGLTPGGITITSLTSSTTITLTTPPTIPSILVVKTASPLVFNAPGKTINYTLTITNNGTDILTNLSSITDTICLPIPTTLGPGQIKICTTSYITQQSDVDNGSIVNTATIYANSSTGKSISSTTNVTVTATQNPSILLVKSSTPSIFTDKNQTIKYSYAVTNTGNVTLSSVGVTDSMQGLTNFTELMSTLAPGVSQTCNATYITQQSDVDKGSISNNAVASGTAPCPQSGSPKMVKSFAKVLAPTVQSKSNLTISRPLPLPLPRPIPLPIPSIPMPMFQHYYHCLGHSRKHCRHRKMKKLF